MLAGSQLLLKRVAGRYHLVSGKESPWKKGCRQGGKSKSLKGAFGKRLWQKGFGFGAKIPGEPLEKRWQEILWKKETLEQ